MEPTSETGPEQFEIQISDCVTETPVSVDSKQISAEASVVSPNCVSDAPEQDLLRASLSDVVLSQSLQITQREVDFEDGGKDTSEGYVDEFDSVVMDKTVDSDIDITFQGDNKAPSQDEFTVICTDSDDAKPDLLAAVSTECTQPEPESHLSAQENESEPGVIDPDFDDAVDPPLLTSTLKTAQEDSDDEFDFDLPAAKTDKGKSVRFSGAGDNEEVEAEETENKDMEKVQVTEASGQCEVASPVSVPAGNSVDVSPVVVEAKVDATVTSVGDVKPSQDLAEKEDRSHIITSSADDWDNVETVEAGFSDGQTGEGVESMTSAPPLLSFSDLWQYFRGIDHTAVKGNIQVTMEKRGFAALIGRLFGPPKLHKDLHADRELVFCMAATAFDNREEQHLQALQTIYRVLTGSRFNCPRFGSHWEEIGFQGRDPATDLRGAGMLALVQVVSFLQDESTAQLARDLYKLSLHPTQNFPFCVMCINMSRISLQALREGALNRECNSQKKVMGVVNQFYAGILLHLYRLWKQGKTISDSGFVIREVETRAKKQPKEVLKDLQAYITAQKGGAEGQGPVAAASKDSGSKGKADDISFFSVVKSDTKSAAELY